MLSYPSSRVSGTTIQPLAGPMALLSSRSASQLSDSSVLWLRSCSPVYVSNIVPMH